VITGFNTDIPFGGVTYHVQTEDKGLDTPLILSLVYVGGAIIAAKRTPYEDLLAAGFDEKELTERLQRQHKLICAAVKAGRIEELKRMSGANGEASAKEEGGTAANGAGKAAGSRRRKTPAQPRAEAGASAESKAAEGKAVEGKTDGVETDEVKASEDKTVKGETAEADAPPEAAPSSRVAPVDFGLDILTNLVDEISALGEVQERQASAGEVANAHADEETAVDVSHFPELEPDPNEPLKVEPLPFVLRGAPIAETVPPEELYLSLLDDEGDFRAGQLATIKVHVGRGAYGRMPVAGASVTVKVLGTTFRPLILTTDTDERGLAIVRALLPRFSSGRAALIIRATSGEEFSELRRIIHQ